MLVILGSNMIILLLFLAITHNGLAITRYPVLEKHLLKQLGELYTYVLQTYNLLAIWRIPTRILLTNI